MSSRTFVAIGGVGGSGTRLIASLLLEAGYNLGNMLNMENDNLYFTLLFKRPDILNMDEDSFSRHLDVFLASFSEHCLPKNSSLIIEQAKLAHPLVWSQPVATSLLHHLAADGNDGVVTATQTDLSLLGWKEPNTHIVLDRLYQSIPNFKYIHVIRNGLDMAFSNNKRQALLWGQWLLGFTMSDPDPAYLLKYWCAVHKRIMDIASQLSRSNTFYLLDYDRLIETPMPVLDELFDFLQVHPTPNHISNLSRLILTTDSSGRFRLNDLSVFDSNDIDYVAELGFPTQ